MTGHPVYGVGYPQDDATPSFSPYSKSSTLGISNEVYFVFEFGKKAKIYNNYWAAQNIWPIFVLKVVN